MTTKIFNPQLADTLNREITTVTVETDNINGIIWVIVQDTATAIPTASQIKNGLDGTGASAIESSGNAVIDLKHIAKFTRNSNFRLNTAYTFAFVKEETIGSDVFGDVITIDLQGKEFQPTIKPFIFNETPTTFTLRLSFGGPHQGSIFTIAQLESTAAPSIAQIKAGLDGSGSPAIDSDVTGLNSQGFFIDLPLTGFSQETNYKLFFVLNHNTFGDGKIGSIEVTTPSNVNAPVISGITVGAITANSLENISFNTDQTSGTAYVVLSHDGGSVSNVPDQFVDRKVSYNQIANNSTDGEDVTPIFSQTIAVSTGTVNVNNITGLYSNTKYRLNIVQISGSGKISIVYQSAVQTTLSNSIVTQPQATEITDTDVLPIINTDTSDTGIKKMIVYETFNGDRKKRLPTPTQFDNNQDSTGAAVLFSQTTTALNTEINFTKITTLVDTTEYTIAFAHYDPSTGVNGISNIEVIDFTATEKPFFIDFSLTRFRNNQYNIDFVASQDNGSVRIVAQDGAIAAPNAAQVIAGQDGTGAAAEMSQSTSILSSDLNNPISLNTGALDDNDNEYDFYFVHDISGTDSDVFQHRILSEPLFLQSTISNIGTSGASYTYTISTNIGDGWVVVQDFAAPTPSVAQIKAGLDGNGAPAVFADNPGEGVSQGTTEQITGLTQNTTYYTFILIETADLSTYIDAVPSFSTLAYVDSLSNQSLDYNDNLNYFVVTVNTDTVSGQLFLIVQDQAIATPNHNQIEAGFDGTGGTPALYSETINVTSNTVTSLPFQLDNDFAYEIAMFQRVDVDTDSNIVNAEGTTLSLTIDLTVTNISPNGANIVIIDPTNTGTGWVVLQDFATPAPNATQIKAGQNGNGAAAIFDDTGLITTNSTPFPVSGLFSDVTYYAFGVMDSATPNTSNVAASLFTTQLSFQDNLGKRPFKEVYPAWSRVPIINGAINEANVIEPSSGKKDIGVDFPAPAFEQSERSELNWLFNIIYQWVNYLDGFNKQLQVVATDPPSFNTVKVFGGIFHDGVQSIGLNDVTLSDNSRPINDNRIDNVVLNRNTYQIQYIFGLENPSPTPTPVLDTELLLAHVFRTPTELFIENQAITNNRPNYSFTQQATQTVKGSTRTSTDAAAQFKIITDVVLTPSNLAVLGSTETLGGLMRYANLTEAKASVSDSLAISPKRLSEIFTYDDTPPPGPNTNVTFLGTNVEYYADAISSGIVFFLHSLTENNVSKTIGPVGSGADFEWSALNSLPTNMRAIYLKLELAVDVGTLTGLVPFFRVLGGATTGSNILLARLMTTNSALDINGGYIKQMFHFWVPIDNPNKIFRIFFSQNAMIEDFTGDMYLRGYSNKFT